MAKVAAAVGAQDFRAFHAVAVVLAGDDFLLRGDLGEARPATVRIKLIVRLEQNLAARRTAVNARLLGVPVFTGERSFGARLAQDVVLFRRQEFAPFSLGALQGKFHSGGIGGSGCNLIRRRGTAAGGEQQRARCE